MKCLLIRFSSIGDIVLTSPVIRAVKKQKNAELHFLTKFQYKNLLEHNPYIDQLHLLKDNLSALVKKLKQEKFDYVIDLHKSLRSRRIGFQLSCPTITFNKLNVKKFKAVYLKSPLNEKHLVERYFEALKPIGIQNDHQGLDYFLPSQQASSLITEHGLKKEGYAITCLSGTYFTKKFPPHKWVELIEKWPLKVVLIGGLQERVESDLIENTLLKKEIKVLNLVAECSVHDSAFLIKHASIVFTGDTGMMHIAAAFKKKIISLWGNTIPAFGMYPYGADPKSKCFEVKNLSCRPCSKLGHSKCPKTHFKCMQDIDTPQIIKYAQSIV